VFLFLTKKIHGLGGHLFAINGVSDHIHLVLSIPVTIALSKFIGQIKAVASTKINKTCFEIGEFKWQRGYAIFSINEKELIYYVRYVENQKTHHAEGTLISDLEQFEQEIY
jgi:REP element-mobilizing transposase RayT